LKRLLGLLFALTLTTGCLHRRAPTPQFAAARKCPIDSVPYQAVYNGVLLNHGELCMAVNPMTNKPMGVFPVQAYNPYTETDMDEDGGDKEEAKAPWWKFWRWGRDKN
jgi:hypothetical protein